MNVLQAVKRGEYRLAEKGVENPRFNVDLLLAESLETTRDQLYLDMQRVLSSNELSKFETFISRRASREPLQYILHRQEFMGLEFYVDERVLIPRPESEILVEKLIEIYHAEGSKDGLKILDLCTGSGVLALSIGHFFPNSEITGVDLSPDALKVARFNSQKLGIKVNWVEGDFLFPVRNQKWDWIVTNPPYVSPKAYSECEPEIGFEPPMAFLGGTDGLEFYRRLAEEARPALSSGGRILMEIGWDQGKEVQAIFREAGYETIKFLDFAGRDRVILAR